MAELAMKIRNSQYGMALLILVFSLSLVAMGYVLQSLSSVGIKNDRDKKDAVLLAEAKAALIGLAIDQVNPAQRPGNLPLPDRLLTPSESPPAGGPPNYDGTADSCVVTGVGLATNWMCLGRLPWKDLNLPIRNPSESDPTGEMPWYSVSGNLVDAGCLNILNSDTLNWNYVNYTCNSPTLPHPWLTVRDKYGNVLSNRVAAVIIIPRLPTAGQARTSSPALGGAGQYLDSITVINAAGCTVTHVAGTYNNAGINGEFIMADDTQRVSTNDPCYQQPYQFNDKLIYITIDELMEVVEKRVAQEAAQALRNYYVASNATPANRYYPYAATLGDVNNACTNNNKSGFIPIAPASATCASSTSCSVSFPMTKVVFNLTAGNYTSKTGLCTRAADICTCTGAGSCIRTGGSGSTFACNAAGNCASTGASPSGTFAFKYMPTAPDTTSTTGACSGGAGTVICSGAGAFFSTPTNCAHPNPGLSTLPSWFTDNHWQDIVTYHLSNDCTFAAPGCAVGSLTVGGKSNVHSVLISAGAKLPTQAVRPTNNFNDYLDSTENANGSPVFDAVGTTRSSTYNDQMFIVAP